MGRSLKKGPFVEERLMKRIDAMNAANEKEGRKRHGQRASTIFPEMVGHTIAVHDGRKHVPVFISEDMVGHRLGEIRSYKNIQKVMPELKTSKVNIYDIA